MTNEGDEPYDVQYEPPCKTVLRSVVACEACGKRVTVHTLRYRHLCVPAVDRLQRATTEAQQAVQARAQANIEEKKANKYAHRFLRCTVPLSCAANMVPPWRVKPWRAYNMTPLRHASATQ